MFIWAVSYLPDVNSLSFGVSASEYLKQMQSITKCHVSNSPRLYIAVNWIHCSLEPLCKYFIYKTIFAFIVSELSTWIYCFPFWLRFYASALDNNENLCDLVKSNSYKRVLVPNLFKIRIPQRKLAIINSILRLLGKLIYHIFNINHLCICIRNLCFGY